MALALQADTKSGFALSKAEIASLTPADIAKLTFDEMVEVVIASEIPVPQVKRLHDLDGEMLVRLVYSARHHCR